MGEIEAARSVVTCQRTWKRNACAVSERDGEAARAITVLDVLDGVTLAVEVCVCGKGKDGETGGAVCSDKARGCCKGRTRGLV